MFAVVPRKSSKSCTLVLHGSLAKAFLPRRDKNTPSRARAAQQTPPLFGVARAIRGANSHDNPISELKRAKSRLHDGGFCLAPAARLLRKTLPKRFSACLHSGGLCWGWPLTPFSYFFLACVPESANVRERWQGANRDAVHRRVVFQARSRRHSESCG